MDQVTLWVKKDSSIEHPIDWCQCQGPQWIALPSQMDCPWCGCGYLWSCASCRKAFTFGVIAAIDGDGIQEVLDHQMRAYAGLRAPWASMFDQHQMILLLSLYRPGQRVAYLDGRAIPVPTNDGPVTVNGQVKRHALDPLPHLAGKEQLLKVLGSRFYWQDEDDG